MVQCFFRRTKQRFKRSLNFIGIFGVVARSALNIVLVPLDSRPACSQFPIMIGNLAGEEIVLPPKNLMDELRQPAKVEGIFDWLETLDFTKHSAVILSTDMLLYGGLVASREPNLDMQTIEKRFQRLKNLRKSKSETLEKAKPKWYGFSIVTRLAPTPSEENLRYQALITERLEGKSKQGEAPSPENTKILEDKVNCIVATKLEEFIANANQVRQRNHGFQKKLLEVTKNHLLFDELSFGQDDASTLGPHLKEVETLKTMAKELGLSKQTSFLQGTDEIANCLVSRAILKSRNQYPKVSVIYSRPEAKQEVAKFEAEPIVKSVFDHILASGASVSEKLKRSDYTLFVHCSKTSPEQLKAFVCKIEKILKKDQPCALVDIDLDYNETRQDPTERNTQAGNKDLFKTLMDEKLMPKLMTYAGWNTTSNSLGTAIPASNLIWIEKNFGRDPKISEERRLKFLLHRLTDDMAFHAYTRVAARKEVRRLNELKNPDQDKISEWSLDPNTRLQMQSFVKNHLEEHLQTYWNIFNKTIFGVSGKPYQLGKIQSLQVKLPWPRLFEASLDFDVHLIPKDSIQKD